MDCPTFVQSVAHALHQLKIVSLLEHPHGRGHVELAGQMFVWIRANAHHLLIADDAVRHQFTGL